MTRDKATEQCTRKWRPYANDVLSQNINWAKIAVGALSGMKYIQCISGYRYSVTNVYPCLNIGVMCSDVVPELMPAHTCNYLHQVIIKNTFICRRALNTYAKRQGSFPRISVVRTRHDDVKGVGYETPASAVPLLGWLGSGERQKLP